MAGSAAHKAMVGRLQREGLLRHEAAVDAMSSVDRRDFIDVRPYADTPQSIGYGATVSAPHMHAIALEGLSGQLCDGANALDIGAGTGYLSACMALMVGPTGRVVGVEHVDELAQIARHNVRKHHANLLDDGRLTIVAGDGRQGHSQCAPFHAIHVGAAAPRVPAALVEQLAPGGRMLVPVGSAGGCQSLKQVDKSPVGKVSTRTLMRVAFVPLTDRRTQLAAATGGGSVMRSDCSVS